MERSLGELLGLCQRAEEFNHFTLAKVQPTWLRPMHRCTSLSVRGSGVQWSCQIMADSTLRAAPAAAHWTREHAAWPLAYLQLTAHALWPVC